MTKDDPFFIEKCLNVLTPSEQEEFLTILETEHDEVGEMGEDAIEALMNQPSHPMTLAEFENVLRVWAAEGKEGPVDPNEAFEQIEDIVKQGRLLENKDED